jgi:hypothetical protein
MVEAQIRYLLRALRFLGTRGSAALDPLPEAQRAFVARVDAGMRGTVWTAGGCRSWYLDPTGRNSTLWPHTTWAYRRLLRRLRPHHYRLLTPAPAEVVL